MPLQSCRRSLRRLQPQPHPKLAAQTAGFLLPLAALLSLLLVLGSLSVQAVSLQGRLRGSTERQLRTNEDRLASAAQLLVARIQLRHACLLTLALEQWATAGCADAADLEQLHRGEVLGADWQLLRWQPVVAPPESPVAAEQRLTLEIALAAQGREPSRRGAFELRLAGVPWQVRELRPLGLRGEAL